MLCSVYIFCTELTPKADGKVIILLGGHAYHTCHMHIMNELSFSKYTNPAYQHTYFCKQKLAAPPMGQ